MVVLGKVSWTVKLYIPIEFNYHTRKIPVFRCRRVCVSRAEIVYVVKMSHVIVSVCVRALIYAWIYFEIWKRQTVSCATVLDVCVPVLQAIIWLKWANPNIAYSHEWRMWAYRDDDGIHQIMWPITIASHDKITPTHAATDCVESGTPHDSSTFIVIVVPLPGLTSQCDTVRLLTFHISLLYALSKKYTSRENEALISSHMAA